jgi:hypothetical protein
MKKILWIEDGATVDLKHLTGPLYASGQYDLVLAVDASDGLRQLEKEEFAAVVADIRIPPGSDQRWIDLYYRSGQNKALARLGLQLLYSLLKPEIARVKLDPIPSWIIPNRFGLFTVESKGEVEEDLKSLNIHVYREKTERLPFTALVEVIEDILVKPHHRNLLEVKRP